MPKISVLIPAYRPDHLDTAIASVFAQTVSDWELIVGDDSDGADVESVVGKWEDPRVRYVRNPRKQMPGANRDLLVGLASGRFIKFVFDDDFLLPRSIELLCAAAEPVGAKLVFHARHVINRAGAVTESITKIPAGRVMGVPPEYLFGQMIGKVYNFIGEPTNTLIDTETVRSLPNPFGVDDMRMRFLTDVALYVNLASRQLPIVGMGYFGSAFRVHAAQTSATRGIAFGAGIFEWDLFNRWAADRGHLAAAEASQGIATVHESYRRHVELRPELAAFLALGTAPDGNGRFMTPGFLDALSAGWQIVDGRRAGAAVGA